MSTEKKKKSGSKTANTTNTISKPLLSLKDIALEIAETELKPEVESLSKNRNVDDEKLALENENNSVKEISDIDLLLKELDKDGNSNSPMSSFVTVRISKKCHKILAELKLDDDFGKYRYGDILESLLYLFIQNNRTELKKRLARRKSSF